MMNFETKLTVPTPDLDRLTSALTAAGAIVLDQGERITTESGVAAEATINVLFVAPVAEPARPTTVSVTK